MADTFLLEIVTPERVFMQDQVEMIIFNTSDGEMGVMPHHADLAAAIVAGPLRIRRHGEWSEVFISNGFIEIFLGAAHMLVQTAEWPDEIDRRRAEDALERATRRMQHQKSHRDFVRAKASIARALARMRVFDDTHKS